MFWTKVVLVVDLPLTLRAIVGLKLGLGLGLCHVLQFLTAQWRLSIRDMAASFFFCFCFCLFVCFSAFHKHASH